MKHDVRMRGFAERTDVEVVDAYLEEHARPLGAETVSLLESVGRVLAEDVVAERVEADGAIRLRIHGRIFAVGNEDDTASVVVGFGHVERGVHFFGGGEGHALGGSLAKPQPAYSHDPVPTGVPAESLRKKNIVS